jgi:hypothetical protein
MSDTYSEPLYPDDGGDDQYSEQSEQQRELIDSFFDVYNDGDDEDVVDSVLMRQVSRRNKKNDELLKEMDKGFAILKPHTKHPIAYFHTNSNPGSTIRNAVTGQYETGFKFGSANEDLFYKVGQMSPTSSDLHILFYDSPEQFEKHFRTTVSAEAKSRWSEKSMLRRREVSRSHQLTSLPTIVR